MSLEKKLDDFATKLIAKACEDSTPLVERTDAFKAVTAYYAAKNKKRGKSDDEDADPEAFTFTGDLINGGQRKAVPARRGS